jgi:photoactive yellow protein
MTEMLKVNPNDIHRALTDDDIDNLPFGAVLVDSLGRIVKYNKAEGDITGRDPKSVIGRNFFTEVAPCTDSPQFYGKFKEGVLSGELNIVFDYIFNYKMNPTSVKIHMMKEFSGDNYWILVKRA